jgi:hypothetical protein
LNEEKTAINRMCGHEASDGSIDNLFMFTKNAESYYFYVPSLTELENLPNVKSSHGKYAKDGKEEIKSSSSNETKKIKVFIEFW